MRLITIILTLLVLGTATTIRAQDIPGPDTYFSANQNKRGKIIKEALALTDKQSQQWQTLNRAFEAHTKEILQHNALSPAQKQEQFNKAQQDHEQHIKALLTEDQYKKYLQWNAKRLERLRALKRMEDRQLPGRTSPGKN